MPAAGVSFCIWAVFETDIRRFMEENRTNRTEKKSMEARKKVICDLMNDPIYVPMKEKELAMFLQVAKEDREELRLVLQELLAEGKLSLTSKGKYVKSNGRFLMGTFIGSSKGFGFVEVEGRGSVYP